MKLLNRLLWSAGLLLVLSSPASADGVNDQTIAASKLRHDTGGAVVHHDDDHRTQQHRTQRLSQEEMLWRYISHIPSRHFKMVRY